MLPKVKTNRLFLLNRIAFVLVVNSKNNPLTRDKGSEYVTKRINVSSPFSFTLSKSEPRYVKVKLIIVRTNAIIIPVKRIFLNRFMLKILILDNWFYFPV